MCDTHHGGGGVVQAATLPHASLVVSIAAVLMGRLARSDVAVCGVLMADGRIAELPMLLTEPVRALLVSQGITELVVARGQQVLWPAAMGGNELVRVTKVDDVVQAVQVGQ